MHPKWHIVSIFLLIEIFTQISVFRLVFFRCHSVSPKWGFHKRFRCPIALPDRLAQLNVLLLCNHIVHYIRLSFLFQSSLPQGERRSKVDQFLDLVKISIHAPTRGATDRLLYLSEVRHISIHAPTRGATLTPRKRSRRNTISIHAPTRGATCFMGYHFLIQTFQSTLPRGERLLSAQAAIKQQVFQSTLPRGERQLLANSETLIEQFQSTLPRGERRVPDRQRQFTFSISIHAPTRGATQRLRVPRYPVQYFNPRSHEGSDVSGTG